MVEVIGDIVMPKELIIPDATATKGQSGASMNISGALIFISGSQLWMNQNGAMTRFSGQTTDLP